MSLFGKTAFSGSRFMFWTLAPVFLVGAVGSAFGVWVAVRQGRVLPGILCAGTTFALLSAILMLFNPQRFSWAGRVVTGAIFGAYLAYAVHEWFFTDHTFRWKESRSTSSPRNALLGLILIGGPCLWFTIRGRWTRRAEPAEPSRPQPRGLPRVDVLGLAPRLERPLLAEEIARLNEATVFRGPAAWRTLLWSALWSGITVGGVWSFFVLLSKADRGQPAWLSKLIPVCFIGSIFTFYAAYSCFCAWREIRGARSRFARLIVPRLQAALADGRASVVAVEAESVIEIEEEETEGSAWLFGLADGTTFYLRGEEYFPAEEDMPWPAKRFCVVRAAINDEWIGLFTEGPELERDLSVAASEMPEDFTWAEEPVSESILPGTPRENLHRFGYEAAPTPPE